MVALLDLLLDAVQVEQRTLTLVVLQALDHAGGVGAAEAEQRSALTAQQGEISKQLQDLQAKSALGLSAQHAYALARNSFDASFIDASLRQKYVQRLDEVFETFR